MNMPVIPTELMAMGDKDLWLKALLDGGQDPNAQDKLYQVPLIFSAIEEYFHARTINKRRAGIHTKYSLSETPLVDAFLVPILIKFSFCCYMDLLLTQ